MPKEEGYVDFNDNPYGSHMRVIRLVGSGKRVLDVGCSSGYLDMRLKEMGCEITGIEINEEEARSARKYCRDVIVGDIESIDIDFPQKHFDVIVFADILEHLKDPIKALKKIRRFLKDDGFVIISVPNIANWSVRLKLLFGKFEYKEKGIMDKTHTHFFTLKSLKGDVKEGGFALEKLEAISPMPFTKSHRMQRLSHVLGNTWKGPFAYQFVVKIKKTSP